MKLLPVAIVAMLLPMPVLAQTTGSVGDAAVPAASADTASPTATVQAGDPEQLAEIMKAAGYRAELTKDDQGDPKINSAAGGANFSVYFYGCKDGTGCTSIQFSSGFDTDSGLDLSVANDWNTRKRYGKVYLDDERDPYLEMDINLTGGISADLFKDNLELWDQMLADFQVHIDW